MTTPQCSGCQYWQKRGGIVRPSVWECTALEDEPTSLKMVLVVSAMAQLLARSGECPTFSPFPAFDGAYRSQDLDD